MTFAKVKLTEKQIHDLDSKYKFLSDINKDYLPHSRWSKSNIYDAYFGEVWSVHNISESYQESQFVLLHEGFLTRIDLKSSTLTIEHNHKKGYLVLDITNISSNAKKPPSENRIDKIHTLMQLGFQDFYTPNNLQPSQYWIIYKRLASVSYRSNDAIESHSKKYIYFDKDNKNTSKSLLVVGSVIIIMLMFNLSLLLYR